MNIVEAIMSGFILIFFTLPDVSSYKYEDGITVLIASFLDASYWSPRLRPEESTTVNVSLNLLAVVDVDMKSQTVTTAGWLNVFWSVSRTQWSSSFDVDTVYLKDGDVWQPSLVAWNGENAEWSLDKNKCSAEKRVVSETNYGITLQRSRLYFNIVLQRRSSFYGLYIFLPTIILSFFSVLSFVIPSSSGDKMKYAATIILAHFLGLATVLTVIPASNQVPLIAIYVILNLVLSAVTIFVCAAISFIHQWDPNVMVSPVCSTATGIFASVTCTDRSTHSNETDTQLVKVKVVAEDDHETRKNEVVIKEESNSHENGGIVTLEKYPQSLPTPRHRFRKNTIVPKSSVSDAENSNKLHDVVKIWNRFFFRFFLIISILFHFSFILVIVKGNNA